MQNFVEFWLLFFWVVLTGTCLGSFVNAAALRYVAGQNWISEPSTCFACHVRLSFWQNLPLYGWLRHAGYSACCKQPIPPRYLLIEIFVGLLAALVFLQLGWQQSLAFMPFFVINCVIFLTDFDDFIIPDWASLGGLGLGLLLAFVNAPGLPPIEFALLGAGGGFALLYGVNFLYRLWRRHDGLGFGDVKLIAMLGAWLGPVALLPILFLAAFAGALVGLALIACAYASKHNISKHDGPKPMPQDKAHLPFGCFLVTAAFLWVLCPPLRHIVLMLVP